MRLHKLPIVGAGVFVLGIIALALGQRALFAEMDAADAAGTSGTAFGFGGLTTIAGLLLTAAGMVLLITVGVKELRRKSVSL